jgi:hypothetical protein
VIKNPYSSEILIEEIKKRGRIVVPAVYILRSEEGVFKIGKSRSFKPRYQNQKKKFPHIERIFACREQHLDFIEASLHWIFRDYRIIGTRRSRDPEEFYDLPGLDKIKETGDIFRRTREGINNTLRTAITSYKKYNRSM